MRALSTSVSVCLSVCVYACAHVCVCVSVFQLLHTVLAATLIAVIARVYREGIPEQPRAKVPREEVQEKKGRSPLLEGGREKRKTKAKCGGVFHLTFA